ncbi:translesion error-prone DNA polymerase V autoproteolytic subunit [uncultured Planktosalinus sp.]|uniref:LexA family protein n=1 Tax=uncultured Planktosalinus sp. TaxID=1810935 RepID=UPI0030D89A4E
MNLRKLQHKNPLTFYNASVTSEVEIPLVFSKVSAGFPSPADDFLDLNIDLNKHLVKNQYTTFLVKVSGNSMQDVGISDGDILIVDKSLDPTNNKIAVCYIDGEFTVKRIKVEKDCVWLVAENPDYKPIKVTDENELIIWGIVINVIKYL